MIFEVGGKRYKITCEDPYATSKKVPSRKYLTKEELETLRLVAWMLDKDMTLKSSANLCRLSKSSAWRRIHHTLPKMSKVLYKRVRARLQENIPENLKGKEKKNK